VVFLWAVVVVAVLGVVIRQEEDASRSMKSSIGDFQHSLHSYVFEYFE
jgi:hypothetical protein